MTSSRKLRQSQIPVSTIHFASKKVDPREGIATDHSFSFHCQRQLALRRRSILHIALSKEAFETAMLFLQLAEPLYLALGHPAESRAPTIEGRFGTPMGAADRPTALIVSLGVVHDLFVRKLAGLYDHSPSGRTLPYQLAQFWGSGHQDVLAYGRHHGDVQL